ncbi:MULTISPECIES: TetR/AcrR family transcriptional regulator [Marinobacter]|uniref:Transcriptional regulator, TetR family n=1 Tax=Marinobacter segnicrescens TaxID=430453 RepID=A0A1I0A2H7_9GAMM|nr:MULTISPECIES: TetR family transcriptional regulator [Marinobacter]UZD66172.1 TetR family transcriptional regulator [Marinobacter sp. AN1]SES87844.1 transcriptional regulator, TetR family [Marinobacter segnicrescens]
MPRTSPRQRRQPLSPERIYRAALALIEENGADDLSMRKLAGALGVDAMSLYHHVENKQALLQGVFQTVQEELVLPEPMPADWKEALRQLGQGFHQLAQRYPRVFPPMITSPWGTEREREIFHYIQRALHKAGVAEQDMPRATSALYTFGIGMANVAANGLRLRPLYGEPEPVNEASAHGTSDTDAQFSIEMMLAGIESLVSEGRH